VESLGVKAENVSACRLLLFVGGTASEFAEEAEERWQMTTSPNYCYAHGNDMLLRDPALPVSNLLWQFWPYALERLPMPANLFHQLSGVHVHWTANTGPRRSAPLALRAERVKKAS
jgi:hypothetical protein